MKGIKIMNNYTDLENVRFTLIDCGAHHLTKYVDKYMDLNISVFENEPLTIYLLDLCNIHEALFHEEVSNGGFSNEGHELRIKWREMCKLIKKTMKNNIKCTINYNREWSRPRKNYIFAETGEIHNGLWWTIKFTIFYLTKGHWTKPMKVSSYHKKFH